ncbi:transketolase [Anaerotalea alkaliphila]
MEQKTIANIRLLSAQMVEQAKSGHPGLPLGAAPMAHILWSRHLQFDPKDTLWPNRDRFVLSAGHGSPLLYALLHLYGYGLNRQDLKDFRQFGSKTPGHPEYGHTEGVEATTGPLGQGIANGVGMAMAERHLAAKFNRPGYPVVDHHTFVLSGDGCMMEGVASEAASLAGTLGLGKLIVLYDSNKITIEGDTDIAFREDVGKRYEAYGFQYLLVEDGDDLEAIDRAIGQTKENQEQPSLIEIRTRIGAGCKAKEGKASAHGEPLGECNVTQMKKDFGMEALPDFEVLPEVRAHLDGPVRSKTDRRAAWQALFEAYAEAHPELAKEWEKWHGPVDIRALLDNPQLWEFEGSVATRSRSEAVINRLADYIPNLIGGSADLAPSTKTLMKNRGDYLPGAFGGSNLHFGVREHGMAGILNGMALHGGLQVYGATFFVFCDYMRPSMRLAALMGLPVTYVLTHDSIGVGEDGPTHQPVEQLASLRCIPNMTVFRPADGKETVAAWIHAVGQTGGPTSIVLTRQNLPELEGSGIGALKGAYVLGQWGTPDLAIIASGSEVSLAMEAAEQLHREGHGVRVVSMPSLELFEKQPEEYREEVLPGSLEKRIVIEAGSSFGWHKIAGGKGKTITMDGFGASGPAGILFKEYGFTVENIVAQAKGIL